MKWLSIIISVVVPVTIAVIIIRNTKRTAINHNENVKLVPLEINLPKPLFTTWPHYKNVPNLESLSYKPRPPIMVPEGTKNVALGKPVFSTDNNPIMGKVELITDGDKEAFDISYVEFAPFLQQVTIDLEARYNIYAIVIWHYHRQQRAYYDVIVQVADDSDFITNVKTLFNNDTDNSVGFGIGKDIHYVETHEGKLINAKGVKARYVRLYSNGNSANELNHYIKVEVYGKPVNIVFTGIVKYTKATFLINFSSF